VRFESRFVGSDSKLVGSGNTLVTSGTPGRLGTPGTAGRLGTGSPPTPGIAGTPMGRFGIFGRPETPGRPGTLGVLGMDTPGRVGNAGALTGLWIEAESKLAPALRGPKFPPAETEPLTGATAPELVAVEAEPALNVAVAMAAATRTE
jgi:hypothetical protein